MVKKVLFLDAAGTLIHPTERVGALYARLAQAQGLAGEATALDQAFRTVWKRTSAPQYAGPSPDQDRGWWRRLVSDTFATAGTPLDTAQLDQLFPALYAHYAQPNTWQVYDDVLPALERLAGTFRLIVLSNFDSRLHPVLEGLGLAPFFQRQIISSAIGFCKPDPRLFAEALRLAGITAAQALHIGDDDEADIAGATQAGWQAWKVHRPEQSLLHLAEELGV